MHCGISKGMSVKWTSMFLWCSSVFSVLMFFILIVSVVVSVGTAVSSYVQVPAWPQVTLITSLLMGGTSRSWATVSMCWPRRRGDFSVWPLRTCPAAAQGSPAPNLSPWPWAIPPYTCSEVKLTAHIRVIKPNSKTQLKCYLKLCKRLLKRCKWF